MSMCKRMTILRIAAEGLLLIALLAIVLVLGFSEPTEAESLQNIGQILAIYAIHQIGIKGK